MSENKVKREPAEEVLNMLPLLPTSGPIEWCQWEADAFAQTVVAFGRVRLSLRLAIRSDAVLQCPRDAAVLVGEMVRGTAHELAAGLEEKAKEIRQFYGL